MRRLNYTQCRLKLNVKFILTHTTKPASDKKNRILKNGLV